MTKQGEPPEKTEAGHPDIIVSPASGFSWRREDVPGAETGKDGSVLCELLRLNRDAASFYALAAKSSPPEGLRGPLEGLKKLHDTVVDDIVAEVQGKAGAAPAPGEPKAETERKHFDALAAKLAEGKFDAALADGIQEAEDQSLARLEAALDEGLSLKTQIFLAGELEKSVVSNEYVKALKAGSAAKPEPSAGAAMHDRS